MGKFLIRIMISVGVLPLAMAAMAPGGVAPVRAGGLKALSGLETGQWELRDRGSHAPARRICLGDPAQLLQIQHPGANCRRFVVSDDAEHAVVTYQCNDAGNGRTDLRVETSRLVQINAQGVADSAPFVLSLEGRRTGECR
jgi:hypothetical protein